MLGLFSLALLASSALAAPMKEHMLDVNGYPVLQMAKDSFKIVQFADLHFRNMEDGKCQSILPEQEPCNSFNTTAFMARVLDAEKPDFAVFTGDQIDGSAPDPTASYLALSQLLVDRNIPMAFVLGNHDEENQLNRQQLMDLAASIPGSIAMRGPEEIHGEGNYYATLVDGNNNPVFTFYFLDSGDYSHVKSIGGYEWIWADQISWFLSMSKQLKTQYGRTIPALSFFHIPLPEYGEVRDKTGSQFEGANSARVNSGYYMSALESGDVKAMFVGHDHINDYCGTAHDMSIQLCYGGGIGYDTYGKPGFARRARLIELSPAGAIRTWKRLDDQDLTVLDDEMLFTGTDYVPRLSSASSLSEELAAPAIAA
eukprot:TRINITY_DN1423_c0_g1::TRINITY_DN1423_c0_g1_i1::g.27128::m.27128 TRINITY_DN1423_c0_g1::TRINITY_DN1423_c0_g1_i1::g.27128  ORF type:complete len:383 (-),score=122.12,sp/Q9FMK9/PPA29_ARATH/39.95/2e-81,Metallophos/PF00149.23/2.9e-14,Metallophos_2/PF12850.2/9.4e-07 TRINITY_DN1423_c0_g1_i1:400-1506(-)